MLLEISQKFTGKHLRQILFFNKAAGLRPATLLKKRPRHRCFPVNFVKFLKTPFCIEHLWWLLLRYAGARNKFSTRALLRIFNYSIEHLNLPDKCKYLNFSFTLISNLSFSCKLSYKVTRTFVKLNSNLMCGSF